MFRFLLVFLLLSGPALAQLPPSASPGPAQPGVSSPAPSAPPAAAGTPAPPPVATQPPAVTPRPAPVPPSQAVPTSAVQQATPAASTPVAAPRPIEAQSTGVKLAILLGVLLVVVLLVVLGARALRARPGHAPAEAGEEEEPEDELPGEALQEPAALPGAERLDRPLAPPPEPVAEPVARPEAEPKAKPQPEPKAKPQPEPKAKPQPEPKAKPQPEPEAAPEARPEAKPEARPVEITPPVDEATPYDPAQAERARAERAARAERQRAELAARAERERAERVAKEKADRIEWAKRQKAEKAERERTARADRERAEQAAQEDRQRAERAERAERERAERERLAREAEQQQAQLQRPTSGASEMMEPSRSLADGLSRTKKEGFVGRLARLFTGRRTIDQELLDQVEEVLYKADIGVNTTERLVSRLKEESGKLDVSKPAKIWDFLKQESGKILAIPARPLTLQPGRPLVLMVVGVNGVGKTTTIGKLAARYIADGKKVVVAAGDTFRAAAVEQLEVWTDRAGATLVKGRPDADPASVVFNAIIQGKKEGADVVIVDTAGRLHTKVPLMEELKKIHKVCAKAIEGTPDEVLLVLDSTNGQNAILQARQFAESIGLTGLILTKLDGTAKGGIILAISQELGLPIRFIGIGEKAGDLRPFVPTEFIEALFAQDDELV